VIVDEEIVVLEGIGVVVGGIVSFGIHLNDGPKQSRVSGDLTEQF
jgi:hypothetical protein